MAIWTHNICRICWDKMKPGYEPSRMLEAELETCCFCGRKNLDVIYIRSNPSTREGNSPRYFFPYWLTTLYSCRFNVFK